MSIKKDLIAKRLERIAKASAGTLTAENVVKDARDPKSPLHDYFDWNDTDAAHQWRLSQARELIRSVKVEIKTSERTVSTVAYVRDPRKEHREQGYVETASIRTKADLAREALARELNAAEGAMVRASSIAIALELESEFTALLDRVRGLRAHINLSE